MSYKFFQNKKCPFFPCHDDVDEFNCLFCFCPLYHMDDCGGDYIYTEDGIKDCSNCSLVHEKDNYDYVIEKLRGE